MIRWLRVASAVGALWSGGALVVLGAFALAPLPACGKSSPCDKLSACSAEPAPPDSEVEACLDDESKGGDCAAARECQLKILKCGSDGHFDSNSKLASISDCADLIAKAVQAACTGYPAPAPAK